MMIRKLLKKLTCLIYKFCEIVSMKLMNLTDREKRVLEDILRFNIKVIYIPKASNLIMDYLSKVEHKTQ